MYLYSSEARAQTEIVGGFLRVDPLLDAEVVNFVASLRPEQLFHDDWLRGLYREALRGWVPESLRLRSDKADFGPALWGLAGGAEGLGTLGDLARCEHLADLGIVEPAIFEERFRKLQRTNDEYLWTEVLPVLSAEAFLKKRSAGSA